MHVVLLLNDCHRHQVSYSNEYGYTPCHTPNHYSYNNRADSEMHASKREGKTFLSKLHNIVFCLDAHSRCTVMGAKANTVQHKPDTAYKRIIGETQQFAVDVYHAKFPAAR